MVTSCCYLEVESTDFCFVVIKVLRNGRWSEEESAILVPGDIISVKLGDIIPADARLLEGDPLKIDQVIANCSCSALVYWLILKLCFFSLSELLLCSLHSPVSPFQ